MWIGANDLTTEGTYEWGLDSGDLVVYESWYGNEPAGGAEENCALMDAQSNFEWHDYGCETATDPYPLCEYTP